MALKTILQYIYLNFLFIDFEKKNANNSIIFFEYN